MEKLEKENAILRFKLREVASVTNLLGEAKSEISHLETKNDELTKCLTDLSAWAATKDNVYPDKEVGTSDNSRRQTSFLDQSGKRKLSVELRRSLAEYFFPVQEGSVQDLRSENEALRKRIDVLQNTSEVTKENKKLSEQVARLEAEIYEKDQNLWTLRKELEKYEKILKTPEHIKDLEVMRLRNIVEIKMTDAKESEITRGQNSCELKDRLADTLDMCKVLASKMDDNVTQRRSRTLKQENHQASEIISTTTEVGSAPMLPHTAMSEDPELLKAELKDILEKNVRWQIYNNQREEYVHRLLGKYNEINNRLQQSQEELVALRSNPDKLSEEQRKHFDNILVQARQELSSTRVEVTRVKTEHGAVLRKLEEDNGKLKRELEHWRCRYEEQREVSARLHADCENEKRRSNCSFQENIDKKEQIVLLQRQIQMYCEDFRSERREKEELQRELKSLSKEISKSKKQMMKNSYVEEDHAAFSFSDAYLLDRVKSGNRKEDKSEYKHAMSPPKMMKTRKHNLDSAKERLSDRTNCERPGTSSREQLKVKRPAPPIPERPPPSSSCKVVSDRERKRNEDHKRKDKCSRGKLYTDNSSGSRSRGGEHRSRNNHASREVTDRTFKKYETAAIYSEKASKELKSEKDTDSESESNLSCPNCGKLYLIDEHLLLLSHIDICG